MKAVIIKPPLHQKKK